MDHHAHLVAFYRHFLAYDPETGALTWQNCRSEGKPAGSVCTAGYLQVTLGHVKRLAHRLAWAIHYGEVPLMRVDHENNRKSDNRIRNLRLATHAQNLQNTGIKRISTTGLLGVSKTKTGRYQAQITAEGAYRSLGTFDTAEEAARVRDTAAIALHGRFAKLNAAIAAQTKTGE